ncbi:MAG: SpoIIE family protein phosphatase [Myxococcota bacterium]
MSFLASWLPFGFVRASASARSAALQSGRIDALDSPEGAATFIVGGKQTDGALPVGTGKVDGAVYSSRGRGYARYNEDAAGLFADSHDNLFGFVLDQAGGLGGQVRGQGSAVAANHIFDACQRVAKNAHRSPDDLLKELELAYERAHKILVQRGEGEVTTAVSACVDGAQLTLLNSGDSGAIHFGKDGQVKNATRPQELGPPNAGCLEHALGLVPEGPNPERYLWEAAPEDWLLLGSDGLFDSGLDEKELGRLLVASKSAEEATNRLCTTVLRRMGTFRGKPDNLSIVVMRVAPAPDPR